MEINNQYDFFKNTQFTEDGKLIVKINNEVQPEEKALDQYNFFYNVDITDKKEVKITVKK